MLVARIEPKQRIAEEDARTLEAALAGSVARDLTPADASVLSGLPLDAAQSGLIALARRFPSRIRVTETGALLFRFASLRRARGPSGWSRFLMTVRRSLLEPLIAALTVLVGPALLANLTRDVVALGSVALSGGWMWLAAIPCMAVGAFSALGAVLTLLYFFVLPLAGLGMLVGAAGLFYSLAAGPGDAGAVAFVLILGGIMLVLGVKLSVFGVTTWLEGIIRHPTWARSLWTGAIGLLVGPPRPEEDALADERRLAALIRHRRGVLALSDLIGLFGWTPAEADSQIARILCDYGGDIVLGDDGAIVYDFSDPNAVSGPMALTGSLMVSAGVEVAPPERVRPPRERFFLGSTALNVVLLVAIGVGLLGLMLHPALPLWPGAGDLFAEMPDLATKEAKVELFGLGLWPYLLLYGSLLLRAPLHLWRRWRRRRRARLEPYLEIAATRPGGAPLRDADLRIVAELGGDYDGTTLSFPELARAQATAERVRQGGRAGTTEI